MKNGVSVHKIDAKSFNSDGSAAQSAHDSRAVKGGLGGFISGDNGFQCLCLSSGTALVIARAFWCVEWNRTTVVTVTSVFDRALEAWPIA